jgi:hypothetical protein
MVSVNVYDSTRSSSSSVKLTILSLSDPTLSLFAPLPPKVNPSDKIVVGGYIDDIYGTFEAAWKVTDKEGNVIDISDSALTPLQLSCNEVMNSTVFNLALSPFALPPKTFVTFKLTARQAILAVSIETNSPPVTGVFAINPVEGVELQTVFSLYASRFLDSDLPLTYTFGFYPNMDSAELQSLMGISESSYVSSNLPAGLVDDDYKIPCLVVCYDSLLASSSIMKTVTVRKLVLDDSAMNDLISSKLDDAMNSGDLDVTRAVLSVSSSVVNFVDCRDATSEYCDSLNRLPCSVTANTCGTCLDGYVSPFVIGNEECISLSSRKLTSFTQKACTNDCNGHGTCIFTNVNSGYTLDDSSVCTLLDPTCEAVCICDEGYDGQVCSYTTEALQVKQSTREGLIGTLTNLANSADVDANSLIALSTNLLSLSSNVDELSLTSADTAYNLAVSIISLAKDAKVSYSDMSKLLTVVDNSIAAILRNASHNSTEESIKQATTFNLYSSLSLSQMIAGESSYISIKPNLRFEESVVTSGSVTSGGLTIAPPLTSLESSLVSNNITFNLASDEIGDGVKIGVGSASMKSSSLSYLSNPMLLYIDDITKCDGSSCSFVINFNNENNITWKGSDVNETALVKHVTSCTKGSSQSYTYYCPEQNVTAECDGSFDGTIVTKCPYRVIKPSCDMLSLSSLSSLSCDVLTYNAMTITCSCTITITATSSSSSIRRNGWVFTRPDSRNLIASNTGSYQFSTSELNYLSYSTEVTKYPSSSVLTVKQVFVGLDVRDFDTDSEFDTNGKIITTAVATSIGLGLSSSDVIIISITSTSSGNRRMLSSSASSSSLVTYTISIATVSSSSIKTALTKVLSSLSLLSSLLLQSSLQSSSSSSSLSLLGYY